MNKDIKSIAIVGGGTAGFVSALILKKTYPDLRIDIIRSTKIGTIGVGEGSTEHWSVFMVYVGIKDMARKSISMQLKIMVCILRMLVALI